MKVFVLTSSVDGATGGWGRYSRGVVDALTRINIDTHICTTLPAPDKYYANFFLGFFIAIQLLPQTKDCDVIHAFIEPYAVIAWWLSVFTRKPYFITAHGTYSTMPYRFAPHLRFFHALAFKHAKAVIAVSTYTQGLLAREGLTNVTVINNGIDRAAFPSGNLRSFSDRDDLMLTVGALKHRKGQHVSLAAFARLAERFPRLTYRMVGSQATTQYVTELKTQIQDLGLESRVILQEHVSDAELTDLYERAKVFALTSLTEAHHFEGFGLVYLEANAHGVPVVGSRNSGAEDAIQEGETGRLIEQHDVEVLTDAIETILSDTAQWDSMSAKGYAWAKAHDWDSLIGAYDKLYRLQ